MNAELLAIGDLCNCKGGPDTGKACADCVNRCQYRWTIGALNGERCLGTQANHEQMLSHEFVMAEEV